MDINKLQTYDGIDISNYVVHLVDRSRAEETVSSSWPGELEADQDAVKLGLILVERKFIASSTFYTGSIHVVCFSEATPAALMRVFKKGSHGRARMNPWGIAFSKQFVFERGGGPVFYVRGDEYEKTNEALDGVGLGWRCTPFWPGRPGGSASTDTGFDLNRRVEFLYEKEWRIRGDLKFNPSDVEYLILNSWGKYKAKDTAAGQLKFLGDLAQQFAESNEGQLLNNGTPALRRWRNNQVELLNT